MVTVSTSFVFVGAVMPAAEALHRLYRHRMMVSSRTWAFVKNTYPKHSLRRRGMRAR